MPCLREVVDRFIIAPIRSILCIRRARAKDPQVSVGRCYERSREDDSARCYPIRDSRNLFIKQLVKKCCADADILTQRVVRWILEDAKTNRRYDGKVASLAWLSLQLVLKDTVVEDEKLNVLRSLLLERLYVSHFMRSKKAPEYIYPTARTDPIIMMEFFKQDFYDGFCVNLRMTKVALEIEVAFGINCGGDRYIMAEIPNRDGVEYDQLWLVKFAKLFLQKRVCKVLMEVLEESYNSHSDLMNDHIGTIIEKIGHSIPPEGWRTAVENGNRSIYVLSEGRSNQSGNTMIIFALVEDPGGFDGYRYDFTNYDKQVVGI